MNINRHIADIEVLKNVHGYKMPLVLIVENDKHAAAQLALLLNNHHFETLLLLNDKNVIQTAIEKQPDLILLDIMLPAIDGISCCKEIRNASNVPIIILTAKAAEIDRIIGLQAGADDYVCKPFSANELILRIKAILRRAKIVSIQ